MYVVDSKLVKQVFLFYTVFYTLSVAQKISSKIVTLFTMIKAQIEILIANNNVLRGKKARIDTKFTLRPR